jgi:hypothetical protein
MKGIAQTHQVEGSDVQWVVAALPRNSNLLFVNNLPSPLPLLPGEIDLLHIYFADLIDAALQGSS